MSRNPNAALDLRRSAGSTLRSTKQCNPAHIACGIEIRKTITNQTSKKNEASTLIFCPALLALSGIDLQLRVARPTQNLCNSALRSIT